MIVTFASNVETHYMGYIVVCPAGEKAILDKKRGGWCYIHCKLKTPSNNNNTENSSSSSSQGTSTTTSFTWGTLRVPAIYLNIDDNFSSSTSSDHHDNSDNNNKLKTPGSASEEDALNPLECVEYKQPGSNNSTTGASTTSPSTATNNTNLVNGAKFSPHQKVSSSPQGKTTTEQQHDTDQKKRPGRTWSEINQEFLDVVLDENMDEGGGEASKRSSTSSIGLIQNIKPTKDTSNALILASYRSSMDSAAIFDQLVYHNNTNISSLIGGGGASSSSNNTPTTPGGSNKKAVKKVVKKVVPTVEQTIPIIEENAKSTPDGSVEQQPIIPDNTVQQMEVKEPTEAVTEKPVEEPKIDAQLDTVHLNDDVTSTRKTISIDSRVRVAPEDPWAGDEEEDLETFDTETDGDFVLEHSTRETFDNSEFDLEELLAMADMEEMASYEPNVDSQQIEIYKTKLPHFFHFDAASDDRKNKLLHHIALQHAARKLVNVGADYDLKLAIQQGLDKTRGKVVNRKATIFSGVSPLQYQDFKKFSVEEAGKLVSRAFADWWKLKKFVNYMKTAPEFKQQRLRQNCLKEILSTERSYVNQLETLYYDFFLPMKKNNFAIFNHYNPAPNITASNVVSRDGLTPEEQYNIIFSNIEQILKTNTALLHDLEMDYKMHYPKNHFPSIFKKILPFLKVYTVYVNNYDKANELVEELSLRNPKFNELLESVYNKKSVTLQSLLITPIQRIPRLKMLFQDLFRRTIPTHVEYSVIEETLAILNELALFVNEKKRHDENNIIFLRLQQILSKRYGNLVTPHRRFLKRDDFRVVCSRKFLNSDCEVYLCNDIMIILPMTPERGLRIDYSHLIFFAFSEMDIISDEDLNDEEKKDFTIRAFLRSSVFTFKFEAINGTERIKWEKDIRELIDMEKSRCKKYGVNPSLKQDDKKPHEEKNTSTSSDKKSSEETSPRSNDSSSTTSTSSSSVHVAHSSHHYTQSLSGLLNTSGNNGSASPSLLGNNGNELFIQEKRMRLFNRSKINNSKLSSSQLQHKNLKQDMYSLSKVVREQKNQIAELEKLLKANEEQYKKFELDYADVEKKLSQNEEEKKVTDTELLDVDSKIMAALGNDADSFMEIFGSEPVCTSTKEKYQKPLERTASSFIINKSVKVEGKNESKNEDLEQARKNLVGGSGGIDELKAFDKELIIPYLALDARRTSDADFQISHEEHMLESNRGSKTARGSNSNRKTVFSMSFGTSGDSKSEKRKTLLQKAKGMFVGRNSDSDQDAKTVLKKSSSTENIITNKQILHIRPSGTQSPVADAPRYGLPTLPGSTNTMPALPTFLSKTSATGTSTPSSSSTTNNDSLESPVTEYNPSSSLLRFNSSGNMKSPRRKEDVILKSNFDDKRPFHYNKETMDSFIDIDARDTRHQQRRVPINASLSAYEELDLDKLKPRSNMERFMEENEEIEFNNPLFKLRPLPSWNTIEQEELNFKYKADRVVHGEDVYFRTYPLPVVIGRERDKYACLYLEDAKDLLDIDKLPDSVDTLKIMLVQMQRDLTLLKEQIFFGDAHKVPQGVN
ncbi:rhoGEF domain-containing protein [Naegleria gruberi]|uniref:RhoGEF domain-containing protein n=1 Tax=Naegleria gruberi TaxID=5762 RepID=D2VNQ6_NAEGR|nr:rhoGEF domain-containing protein [Naegleria gruberi]EFC41451.1 rhoGEF domain-containing protein [Naegleria gruberi]|eukprot:XP_002674195.1 rhoGEF domain-containing protein [Naegleria gruberi strain NEG-M]